MTRAFDSDTLVLATHNKAKVGEIGSMLAPFDVDVLCAGDLGLPEPEETGLTFEENAVLKAVAAAQESGKIALADDSGIAVNSLGGEPGIYSARWGGEARDFQMAMGKVNDKLGDNPDRSAAFVCVLALAWPDGHVETFEGRCEGEVIWPPRGEKGFGYDPMFVPEGENRTFAEMEAEEKRQISHRAKAFDLFISEAFKARKAEAAG